MVSTPFQVLLPPCSCDHRGRRAGCHPGSAHLAGDKSQMAKTGQEARQHWEGGDERVGDAAVPGESLWETGPCTMPFSECEARCEL